MVVPEVSFMCHSAATLLPDAMPVWAATVPSTATARMGAANAPRTNLDI
jgi:hypothetical protein